MFGGVADVGGAGAAGAAWGAPGRRGGVSARVPVGVPGGAVAAALWAALCVADRPVTARQLADAVGTRRESANRVLLKLERAGCARRERGDVKASMPDLWSPIRSAHEADQGAQHEFPELVTDVVTETESPDETVPVSRTLVRGARMRAVSSVPPAEPGTLRHDQTRRLAAGELEELVHEVLAGRPGEDFSTLQLSRMLGGRSQGAVANACRRLVAKGEAACSCPAPLRFTTAG